MPAADADDRRGEPQRGGTAEEHAERAAAHEGEGDLPAAEPARNGAPHVEAEEVPLPPRSFPQAHLIQGKIRLLYEQELAAWNADRQAKIEQAVGNLKSKHAKERELLNKRVQIQLEDINNEWHQQKIALLQRYNLTLKELRASQEREFLSFRREFKTKGGVFSSKFADAPNDSSLSH